MKRQTVGLIAGLVILAVPIGALCAERYTYASLGDVEGIVREDRARQKTPTRWRDDGDEGDAHVELARFGSTVRARQLKFTAKNDHPLGPGDDAALAAYEAWRPELQKLLLHGRMTSVARRENFASVSLMALARAGAWRSASLRATDPNAALEYALDVARLGALLTHSGMLIPYLVGLACLDSSMDAADLLPQAQRDVYRLRIQSLTLGTRGFATESAFLAETVSELKFRDRLTLLPQWHGRRASVAINAAHDLQTKADRALAATPPDAETARAALHSLETEGAVPAFMEVAASKVDRVASTVARWQKFRS